jgi:hypothetical protein
MPSLSDFLVPIVAILGLLIAYWQWRTAQDKLKFDLFDRRMAVYEAARTFIRKVRSTGRIAPEDEFAYSSAIDGARWLFDADIERYLERDLEQGRRAKRASS